MIEENSNKAILFNTAILYGRLVLTSIFGLLTTRFALQALGATAFGLFAVVGGVISFMAIFNTIMLSCSNRFITMAIGRGNEDEINAVFNVCRNIHLVIALLSCVLAIPLGDWYILHYINFDGDIHLAVDVYNITMIGSIISFVGVPYNGLLMAKERFWVFCSTEVLSSLLKMIGAWLLIYYFANKLVVYALLLTVLSALPTLLWQWYCKKTFPQITRFYYVKEIKLYKEIFEFSIWVGYGAFATIGKSQGSALIVNAFFNTLMNAALGLANSVSSIVHVVATNMTKSIAPQITKAFAVGDMIRCERLVILSSKVSFIGLFIVSSPFFVAPEWILGLWLVDVPPYTTLFVQLLLIDVLIGGLNAGIPEVIFASGKIRAYQLIVNTLFLISVFVAWMVLYMGGEAYMMFVVYIIFSVIIFTIRQIVLNKVVKFNNLRLLRESYLPSFLVLLCSAPLLLIDIHPIVDVMITMGVIMFIVYIIALNRQERKIINDTVVRCLTKCNQLFSIKK